MLKFDCYVYALCYPDGVPFYIGAGTGSRWLNHGVGKEITRNNFKQSVIDKLSKEGKSFIRIKIKTDLSREEAFKLEKEYIKKYGRRDLRLGLLTNLTDGGEGFIQPSPEAVKRGIIKRRWYYDNVPESARENMSKAKLGVLKSKEFKELQSQRLLGKNKGKVRTEEQKEWLGKVHKNRVLFLQNNGKYLGKKLTVEDVLNIRQDYLKEEILSTTSLVEKYGVTKQNILYILKGTTWKNAKGSKHLIQLCKEKVEKLGVGRRDVKV